MRTDAGANSSAPCPPQKAFSSPSSGAAPRVHLLLRSRNLKVRHKLKDVKREVERETIKLKHAVMERASKRETIKL